MKWYAIFVETGREEEVQKFIELLFSEGEIRTLVPKRKLIERRQGKTYEIIRNLIPGYVLTHTSMSDELYYKLKELPAVYRILKDDCEPTPIRDEEMSMILSLTRYGEIIELSDVYKEGNQIKVLNGPLKGMEGIIEKFDHRKKRVKARIEFLGEYKRVDLGANMVVPNTLDTEKEKLKAGKH
ncbi:MAG: antiterminator LoaP [Clostridiales bacterium]|nr:antiterminator LoaP [Clostridiales bacterium]